MRPLRGELFRVASSDDRRLAERWCLANGLPAVLRPGVPKVTERLNS